MATPSQSVQFRDPDDLVAFYRDEGIPAFSIKQRNALNFKYEGDSLDEGIAKLIGLFKMMVKNKTAAIYTLCQYNSFGEEITDKTPASLSNNFRFNEYGEAIGAFGGGGGGDLAQQLKDMREDIKALREEREEGSGHKLGMIGEILEMEAVQPLVLAVAGLIADKITQMGGGSPPAHGPAGELKRVSGIPGVKSNWKDDPEVMRSLDTLNDHLDDFPELMAKLARIALNSPFKFKLFTAGLRRMSD